MKRIILYLVAGITVLFLIAVAHYSLKEAAYNLSDKKPVQLTSGNVSSQVGKYVTVKGAVDGTRVARVGHNGIDMYFYAINGFGKKLFVVTDGNPLPTEMLAGKTAIKGELKELGRIPFARSVYKDLKTSPGTTYYAIKAGKAPNPGLILTYSILLVLGALLCIPIFIELKVAREKPSNLSSEFAQANA